MRGRAMRRLASPLVAVAVAWPILIAMPVSVAGACDAMRVPFQRIIDDAEQVFLVTIAQRSVAGTVPEAYTFVVRESLRGALPDGVTLPTTVSVAAPVINGCGDVLDQGMNTHLVIALDVPAFDGAAPISVPWRLNPDGSLVGGHDDGPTTWVDVDALRAALEGEPYATPAPTRPPDTTPVDPGAPLATFGIVAGIVLGIAAGVAVIVTGRRAARPAPPRPPSEP